MPFLVMIYNFVKPMLTNKYTVLVLVGVALLGGGYLLGRYSTPAKVVEKTVVQEKIVYRDHIVEKTVYVQAKQQNKHKETVTTTSPDGTKVEKVVEDTSTKTDTNVNKDKTEDKIQVVEKLVYKERIVINHPNWKVGASAGVLIPQFTSTLPEIGVPGMKGSYVEVSLGRRLAGPAWMTVQASTLGTIGAGLEFTF